MWGRQQKILIGNMRIKTLSDIKKEGRKPTDNEIYDARMTYSGFGAPDCTCHVSPPCSHCVNWCPKCKDYTYGECPVEHYD